MSEPSGWRLAPKGTGQRSRRRNDAPSPAAFGIRCFLRELDATSSRNNRDRDQHPRRRNRMCESGWEEPVPGKGFAAPARVPDRKPLTRIKAPNSSKVSTTCTLAVAVIPQVTSASTPRTHGADAGCPKHVVEPFRRDKFERRSPPEAPRRHEDLERLRSAQLR